MGGMGLWRVGGSRWSGERDKSLPFTLSLTTVHSLSHSRSLSLPFSLTLILSLSPVCDGRRPDRRQGAGGQAPAASEVRRRGADCWGGGTSAPTLISLPFVSLSRWDLAGGKDAGAATEPAPARRAGEAAAPGGCHREGGSSSSKLLLLLRIWGKPILGFGFGF